MLFLVAEQCGYRGSGILQLLPHVGLLLVCQTHVALSAVFRPCLVEVSQQLPAAAYVVVGGVAYDGVYAFGELLLAVFVHVARHYQVHAVHSVARVCYDGCLAAWHEVQYALLRKSFQKQVHLLACQSGLISYHFLVDVRIVVEQRAVVAQQCRDEAFLKR